MALTLPIRAAVVEGELSPADARPDALREALEGCAAHWRERHAARPGATVGDVPGIEHARRLFRALGIDPTRRRPSSEALLRRALKGGPMPVVNPPVDVGNWCSLEWLLPLGVYARDALEGDVVLRLGEEGDGYDALNGRRMDLAGRYLLADGNGPFGSPMTDSVRTSVQPGTSAVFVVVYAPLDLPAADLRARGDVLARRLVDYCGGREVSHGVVESAPSA